MSGRAIRHSRRLRRDERGVTAMEFGFLAPVFLTMLLGFFDVGHGLFMKAMLEGELQRAARNSSLEAGGVAANQAAVDQAIRDQVQALARQSTVAIDRRFFKSFSKAAAAQAEPWVDSDTNQRCNGGETYTDENSNGVHDMDGGDSGQGGAKDSVMYTVTVTYKRLFPLSKLVGLSDTVTFKAMTVMNNQPYGEQTAYATPVNRVCPA